ncbi:DUF2339 domain-containing protein [Mucilaginibacter sp.]|uniref:DUF2339 domain-containing protein n=1 Tax=Mucilaginibacter sp. TaxID=1882438 RepID=UPI0028402CDE|nr:DUF2339 domain-containing protein [Mucilaginibacter sp.]MDR3695666.1 DUF2339 domain-containing protein [Mucilaginibacter sp.]
MDAITIILLLVILILLITNRSGINDKFRDLEHRIIDLQNQLRAYQQTKATEGPKSEVKSAPVLPTVEEKLPGPPIPPEFKLPEPPNPAEIKPEPVVEKHPEVIYDVMANLHRPVKTFDPPPNFSKPQPEPKPELSFFERYPDLEKFIGENLVNKIGIAILVLAIGFFVKYAIDNNWVGPVGRVGIGIFCGAILVGFAHRMRNNYKAFSSVLTGGGLAVFYFTITLAFQQFHLFSQLIALCILIVITVFAVLLALLYDKQELAVIALIGGFASPFLVSNGTANYNGLFTYLLILNTGLLVIAYFKAWRILNISSFGLSVIVFATVLYTLTGTNYYIGLRFATIFYLLFFIINIINNIRENKNFLAIDFSILLINTALYFAAGLYLLTEMGLPQYRGLFSTALALINLVLSYILFRKKTVDPNILYLLIGITLTFISLTAPIQLHGNNITLFWASEAVLLYWLYLKSSIRLMQLTSTVIFIAMIFSLLMDISNVYVHSDVHLAIIANKGFITTIVAAVASYLLYILVKKDPQPDLNGLSINKNLFRIVAVILFFLGGLLEVNHQYSYYYPNSAINILYLALYVPVFVYLLQFFSAKMNGADHNWELILSLLGCTATIYLFLAPVFFNQLEEMLELKKISVSHFAVHWISDIFIAMIFYSIIRFYRSKFNDATKNTCAWLLTAAIVTFLSLEICLLGELFFYSKQNSIDTIQTVYIKTTLPVLWGVISFILMWLGMRNKQRNLRIISLSLFTITLLKLFIFDINNIPVAGKIAAFFCLGVLLLIISFMYQKVKKIIVDDEAKSKD